MKKILFLTLLSLFGLVLVGKNPPNPSSAPSNCTSSSMSHTFYNLVAYGDQLLGTYQYGRIQDFINAGYKITITIKGTSSCTFSWSKSYSLIENYDLIRGNTVYDLEIPRSDFTITIKILSVCVYDSYFSSDVAFVWTKTVKPTDNEVNLGFPSKQLCTSTDKSRSEVVSGYESSGRVSSSDRRTGGSR